LPHQRRIPEGLWEVVDSRNGPVLQAAAGLALYDPHNLRWDSCRHDVADRLVKVPTTHFPVWMSMFEPVREVLLPVLTEIHADSKRSPAEKQLALEFIIQYEKSDCRFLVQAIETANPDGLQAIVSEIRNREPVALLERRLSVSAEPNWNDGNAPRTFQTFFKRQGMQEPINLCTDWLIVGHVDELVTFVPRKNGELTMLIASPKKALEILKGLGPAQELDSKYRDSYGVSTVGELLDLKYLGTVSISALNQEVDEKLFGLDHANPSAGSVKKTFMDALSLKSEDIIEVPILFQNYEYASGKFAAVALTPSLVNLYCLERDLIVPKQFLTSFETEFMQAVADLNLKVHWVDDWDLYHTGFGEIHCGSNSRRDVFNGRNEKRLEAGHCRNYLPNCDRRPGVGDCATDVCPNIRRTVLESAGRDGFEIFPGLNLGG
ncbi:MAG: protein-arginine deiminase family protein, partial [Pirellulaceae bacterium]